MTNNPTQLTLLQDDIRRRYETLSKRLKQVARYILDTSNRIAFDTVASIAQQADVPPSTLIRFANAFGFSGFNEMKQVFRQHLMEETVNYTERARLFRQTATDDSASSPESPMEILNVFTMVNSQALQQLAMQINPEQLNKAVQMLNEAENIYIIGLRRSFSVELVELGARRGAHQIAITDSQVSPLAAFSDVCFVVREAQVDGFRSQVASLCLAQTLAVSLALTNSSEPE